MARTRMHRRRNVRPLGRVLLLVSVAVGAVAVLAPAAQAAPTLTVTKTATPAGGTEVKPGDTITYSVVVKNTATGVDPADVATDVKFTDATPANTTYVAGSAKVDTVTVPDGADPADPNPFKADYALDASLTQGEQHTVEFKVKVKSPTADATVITNTAKAKATNHPTEVTSAVTHTVDSAPSLKVTASAEPAPGTTVAAGAQITFTASVSNEATATDSAKTVVYKDPTPEGTTYVDGSSTLNGAPVPDASNPFATGYALGDIPPGTIHALSYKVTVNSGAGAITRTVTVTAANAPAEVTATTSHTGPGPAAPAEAPQPTRGTRGGGGGRAGGGGGGGGTGAAGAGSTLETAGTGSGAEGDLALTGLDTPELILLAFVLFLVGVTLIARGRTVERRAVTVWDEARVRASRLMTRDPSVGPWFFSARRR